MRDYDSQLKRITKGKGLLEQVIKRPVTTFIPPWNRYDKNTLKALEELGYQCICAGRTGVVSNACCQLKFLPYTCSVRTLKAAVRLARKSGDRQPLIVVLFHPYDFDQVRKRLGNVTLERFSALLDWLVRQDDVRVVTVGQMAQEAPDLSAQRYASFGRFVSRLDRLSLPLLGSFYFYPTVRSQAAEAARGWRSIIACYLAVLLFFVVASFILGRVVLRRRDALLHVARYGTLAILALVAAHVLYAHSYTRLAGVLPLTCAFGTCVGVWIATLRVNRLRKAEKFPG